MATLEEALHQAAASSEAGRPDIAEQIYRAILAKFPQNAEARTGLQNVLAMQGKSGAATDTLRQSDIDRLLSLYGAGRLADTEAMARALSEKFPGALILHNVLGAALLDQGKAAEAVDSFKRTVELEPGSPECRNNLGIAHQGLGAREKAVENFREAVRLKPDYAEAYNNLGVALADLGRLEESVDSYQAALSLTPESAEAHNNLGAALAELESYESAVECYGKALQYKPDYAEAHNNLGNALLKLRQREEAVASYRRALEIEPGYAEALNNLGNALHELGHLDEALDCFQRALVEKPGLLETLNNLGNVYRELDRFDDAVERFQTILSRAPDHAEALNNLGVTYKDMGRIDDAIAQYRRALELKPDFVDARINLGGALLGEEKIDEAIEHYRLADPENESTKISALLLECYFRKNDMTAFNIQLQMIKKRQPGYNFRAGAAAAFVAQQTGTENIYPFCGDPLGNVAVFNLFEEGIIDDAVVESLSAAVHSSGGNERFAPGHISSGYKSVGNLFRRHAKEFDDLEALIRRYIGKYHEARKGQTGTFIESWPQNYVLDGWYIRLLKGGEITAHIHSAWLSGILYLKVPDKNENDEGNIEFTLRGYELPVLRDDYPRRMIETQPGALVFFPSSLPHRVIPFTSDAERICIPFDVIPN